MFLPFKQLFLQICQSGSVCKRELNMFFLSYSGYKLFFSILTLLTFYTPLCNGISNVRNICWSVIMSKKMFFGETSRVVTDRKVPRYICSSVSWVIEFLIGGRVKIRQIFG